MKQAGEQCVCLSGCLYDGLLSSQCNICGEEGTVRREGILLQGLGPALTFVENMADWERLNRQLTCRLDVGATYMLRYVYS